MQGTEKGAPILMRRHRHSLRIIKDDIFVLWYEDENSLSKIIKSEFSSLFYNTNMSSI